MSYHTDELQQGDNIFIPLVASAQDDLTSLEMQDMQVLARGLLDVLREVTDKEKDFIHVMDTFARISKHKEPVVRAELMKQISNVVTVLHETQPNLREVFLSYVIPIIIRYLMDPKRKVHKASEVALSILLNTGFLSKDDFETKVCPVLLQLTEPQNFQHLRSSGVSIMCKVVTMLSKDTVEHLLLPRFCDLCSDEFVVIRKICAERFGQFCSAVGREATENVLIPKFCDLCSDSKGDIRKACVECFIMVSNSICPAVRHTKLLPLYIRFMSDQTFLVRKAALHSLALFMCTVANPSAVLHFSEDGPLQQRPHHSFHLRTVQDLSASDTERSVIQTPPPQDGLATPSSEHISSGDGREMHSFDDNHSFLPGEIHSSLSCSISDSNRNTKTEDADDKFNSFYYWKSPLPDISAELEMLKCQKLSEEIKSMECSPTYMDAQQEEMQMEYEEDPVVPQSEVIDRTEKEVKEYSADSPVSEDKPKTQNVIPQQLLDQYLSMTDLTQVDNDLELVKDCACTMPCVALTLGRENWHCLKNAYKTLATNKEKTVRCTVAASLHQLAIVLGTELTTTDLVPVYNSFLSDVDDVRFQALAILYNFLQLLHADKRREYLYQLQNTMMLGNSRNWRLRYQLAKQLILIIELYSHCDVHDYLRQIALTLCSDKVSQVRWISYKLVVAILQKLHSCGASDLGLSFISELTIRFLYCSTWVGRQIFAFICLDLLEKNFMPMEQFCQILLPSLLSLSSDPVPNVRIPLAKALRRLMDDAYVKEPGRMFKDKLLETVRALQCDEDPDVRLYASMSDT